MPTARELLEQADALMRRNRARAAALAAEPEPDIPVLTEPVGPNLAALAARSQEPRPVKSEPTRASATAIVADVAKAAPPAPRVDDDFPLLTDAVEEIEAPAVVAPTAEGEPSDWLELEHGEGAPSITGPAPDSIAVVPPATLRPVAASMRSTTAPSEPVPEPEVASIPAASERTPPPAIDVSPPADVAFLESIQPPLAKEPNSDAAAAVASATIPGPAWEALAEEVRMQVLQRIDIFTDTGLREKLGERLKPIVDRASADLVATINQHVGDLLRAYVAEAIEREIERWRDNNR